MRRLFRWVFRLALALLVLAVVCAVAAILLLDTLAREILAGRLRAATGMEVKVGAVHVGLLSPTVSIEGLKLYNTADFGGALCLDMPELHIEYDPAALRARQLHLTLLRFNLASLSLVADKHGRKNFAPPQTTNKGPPRGQSAPVRWKFIGIDVLNATLGRISKSNMASGQGKDFDLNVHHRILHHVKDWADLAPLGLTAFSRDEAKSAGEQDADLSALLDRVLKAP